jgi:hypothetical protein
MQLSSMGLSDSDPDFNRGRRRGTHIPINSSNSITARRGDGWHAHQLCNDHKRTEPIAVAVNPVQWVFVIQTRN